MKFVFKRDPICNHCGNIEPWIPIAENTKYGDICPWCAYSEYLISDPRLDTILDKIEPLKKFYEFKKKLGSNSSIG